jgi:hypothetical protein
MALKNRVTKYSIQRVLLHKNHKPELTLLKVSNPYVPYIISLKDKQPR